MRSACFNSNCADVCNFYPLEVVCRGSDTKLQAGKTSNFIRSRFKGSVRKSLYICFRTPLLLFQTRVHIFNETDSRVVSSICSNSIKHHKMNTHVNRIEHDISNKIMIY